MEGLTKERSSQPTGACNYGSSYPESETLYFKRVYGSDNLSQLHDKHQDAAIRRYCRPERRGEIERILSGHYALKCKNEAKLQRPGRSAIVLSHLTASLQSYLTPDWRSLRWNQHYRRALEVVRDDIIKLLPKQRKLKPISLKEVSESDAVQRNLSKNAGYFHFVTGKRSKGENLDDALKWCEDHCDEIRANQHYGLPIVITHRSSNSRPCGDGEWKYKGRVAMMQDMRAQLFDGRFIVPFNRVFSGVAWGEGSMNHEEVQRWMDLQRKRFEMWYSSDYSKFDMNQSSWLLEDVFYKIIKPCFELGQEDELLFTTMVNSYINKEVHSFDGIYHIKKGQLSGALSTYSVNTIVNEVMDTTVKLMQGFDLSNFVSLKCGDDNINYYRGRVEWDPDTHCKLIQRYFGIETTMGDGDFGSSDQDPVFLSRTWTLNGAERDISEVLWNLRFPERYRDYKKIAKSEEQAEALLLYCAYLEQPSTMRHYFNTNRIKKDAAVGKAKFNAYRILASLGHGFNDPWVHWKLGLMNNSSA